MESNKIKYDKEGICLRNASTNYEGVLCLQEGTKSIADFSMRLCTSVSECIFPASVERIGRYALAWCKNIERVSISSPINEIGRGAFYGCLKLKSLDLSTTKIDTISPDLFYYCSSLESIYLPGTLTRFDHSAFVRCDNIQNIFCPKSCVEKYKSLMMQCNVPSFIISAVKEYVSDNEYMSRWKEYEQQWASQKKELNERLAILLQDSSYNIDKSIPFSYPQTGIQLTCEEYRYYKSHKYDLDSIHAWCMSGRNAHEYMRFFIPKRGYNSLAGPQNVDFSMDMGAFSPRAGFYKVIEKVGGRLFCYYSRENADDFIEELVQINERFFHNSRSARGPINARITENCIIYVSRTELKHYIYKGEERGAYGVEWCFWEEGKKINIYTGVVKNAETKDEFLLTIINKSYSRILLVGDELSVCGKEFKSYKNKECWSKIMKYNEEQLESLVSFLSNNTDTSTATKEVVQDLCNKSPIISLVILTNSAHGIMPYEPLVIEKLKVRNGYYGLFHRYVFRDYYGTFNVIIEGYVGKDFNISYYFDDNEFSHEFIDKIHVARGHFHIKE